MDPRLRTNDLYGLGLIHCNHHSFKLVHPVSSLIFCLFRLSDNINMGRLEWEHILNKLSRLKQKKLSDDEEKDK